MEIGEVVYHRVSNVKGKIVEIRGKDIFVEWEESESKTAYLESELVKEKGEMPTPKKIESGIVLEKKEEVKKKKRGRRKK